MKTRRMNGEGTLRQRSDGSWEYRGPVGENAYGGTVIKSFYSRDKNGAGARRKYKDYLLSLESNGIPQKSITVASWARKWLELYKKGQVSAGTYRNYELYIEKHIIPALGPLKMDEVRPAHIMKLYQEKAHLSGSALHHLAVTLNGIFETAIDNDYCRKNPCRKAPPRVEAASSPQYWTKDEVAAILKFVPAHYWGGYIGALLYTGLRIGELCALQWSDINFELGEISVTKSLARTGTKGKNYDIKYDTKTHKDRVVSLSPDGLAFFQSLPRHGFYVVSLSPDRFVSPDSFRRHYDHFFQALNAHLAEEHEAQGKKGAPFQVRRLSPHKARHTYATFLLKGTDNLRVVQEQLGHSRVNTTEIYAHVDTESRRESLKKLTFS